MSKQKLEAERPSPLKGGPVLVAVDFTADSEAAFIWGCEYAECAGATVVVLHVVHDPGDAPGSYRRKEEDALRPSDEIAREMMVKFLEDVRKKTDLTSAGEKAESLVIQGIPATRILEAAEKIGAQIIVMGSRGRTGLPHLLLGSKAERVVQLSPIPVTIVKAEAHDD